MSRKYHNKSGKGVIVCYLLHTYYRQGKWTEAAESLLNPHSMDCCIHNTHGALYFCINILPYFLLFRESQRVLNDVGQAFCAPMIRLRAHPLSRLLAGPATLEDWEREATCWRESGEGGGRGAESYDHIKAWPSINHSILSGESHLCPHLCQRNVLQKSVIIQIIIYFCRRLQTDGRGSNPGVRVANASRERADSQSRCGTLGTVHKQSETPSPENFAVDIPVSDIPT